ncbi:MAG: AAA family ATPase [Thermoplasmata archaeon]|nr:AAA family ATPase [Thermoplasmata archaeon]
MFGKSSIIIKDQSKFSFDYVPKVLVHRESQMGELTMLFRPVVESGMSETAFLTGNVGSGKTATAKRFCSDMMEYCAKNNIPMDYVLVNCRQKNTESSILLQLVRHFDPGFPDRGFSTAEMMRTFRASISKSKKRFVIILDEVDVLFKKGIGDLIYQLSRFNEDSSGNKLSVSMILISQEYVLDRLDEASLSSFKRSNTVRFRPYDRDEIRSILQSRAEECLKEGTYDDGILDLLADASCEYGDARFAIDLLDKTARIAESKDLGHIDAEDVRAAKAMIYSVVTETKLQSLDANRLLTLLAISRSIRNKPYITIEASEKTYAIACEEYDYPARKHTQYFTYIKDLEKNGLIKIVKIYGDDSKAPTSMISVPDIPSRVLADKIVEILEEIL